MKYEPDNTTDTHEGAVYAITDMLAQMTIRAMNAEAELAKERNSATHWYNKYIKEHEQLNNAELTIFNLMNDYEEGEEADA